MKLTEKKQSKIFKILSLFSNKRLEKITEDNFSFSKMSRQEMYFFMECVWITLGKEQATNKEMAKGINEVLALAILETLRRRDLVKINKEGNFSKTKFGKEVMKLIKKKEQG